VSTVDFGRLGIGGDGGGDLMRRSHLRDAERLVDATAGGAPANQLAKSRHAAEFGMTPSSRSRIEVDPPAPEPSAAPRLILGSDGRLDPGRESIEPAALGLPR
jgi:hypothetical protein